MYSFSQEEVLEAIVKLFLLIDPICPVGKDENKRMKQCMDTGRIELISTRIRRRT